MDRFLKKIGSVSIFLTVIITGLLYLKIREDALAFFIVSLLNTTLSLLMWHYIIVKFPIKQTNLKIITISLLKKVVLLIVITLFVIYAPSHFVIGLIASLGLFVLPITVTLVGYIQINSEKA